MQKKVCPICESDKYSKLVYEKKLPEDLENPNFAGRKDPDGYHYQMLRCENCTLLYASEIYDEEYSNQLYNESSFDYSSELEGLTKSYSETLKEGIKLLENSKENFLEIGCGNGFMLQEALRLGFKNVKGIEPSKDAISFADNKIKNFIQHGIFDENLIENEKYDLVFIAMIIEHVVDSNKFLESIYKVLKPGGMVICVCHNEKHFLAKILKEKHPIINDEHVAVFNEKALNLIFKKNNFLDIKVRNLKNYYSLSYWLKMMPIPIIIKNLLNKTIVLIFKKLIIGFKAGNQYLIAKKN
jgi:2-polyprenyl-3-methyl-5-hydroxy-6-metoxy-1,4-benzoquinol methylase